MNSLGPLLLGTIFNVTLLGMMLVQVYFYSTRFWGKDKKWTSYMVAFLLLADLVNSALDVAFVYKYTITNFGNMEAIQVSDWVFNSVPIMTSILSSVCQSFFAWRVLLLTGRRWLFVLLLVAIVIQVLMGLGTSIACTIVKYFADFQKFRVVVIFWLGISAAIDAVITYTLVRHLHSSRTGLPATDTMLTKLIRLTVETGMITVIWATIDLIIYLVIPNPLHLMFNIPLGKLYTNSLMSTLNSRAKWAEESSDRNPGGFSLQMMSTTSCSAHKKVFWPSGRDKARPESDSRENGVIITSDTIVHCDGNYEINGPNVKCSEFIANGNQHSFAGSYPPSSANGDEEKSV